MNEENNTHTARRIPVEGDFMHTMYSDKWYSYLQCISVRMKSEDDRDIYVVFKKRDLFSRGSKIINTSLNTVKNKHKKLIEGGFIEEITIKDNFNKEKEVYKISYINTLYQMVDVSVLEVLYTLKTESMIKIYAYLLNKFIYYKDKNYIFTKGELVNKCLGLKNKDDKNSLRKVELILSILKDMKLVDFKTIRVELEDGYTYRKELVSVGVNYKVNK